MLHSKDKKICLLFSLLNSPFGHLFLNKFFFFTLEYLSRLYYHMTLTDTTSE